MSTAAEQQWVDRQAKRAGVGAGARSEHASSEAPCIRERHCIASPLRTAA